MIEALNDNPGLLKRLDDAFFYEKKLRRKLFMKRFVLLMLVLFTVFGVSACEKSQESTSTTSATTEERPVLVVGMEAAYAPFNWTVSADSAFESAVELYGSNNYVDGYDVVIAKLIAEELGYDLVIKAVEWDGLIPSLVVSEEIDLIIAGMSPTAERAQTVAFTSEYYQSTHVVLLRSDSVYANSDSIDDFAGANGVAQLSTIYDDLIVQLSGVTHSDPLQDVPTIVTAINQGTYDLTILELPVAQAIIATNPDLTYIEFAEGSGFDIAYEDSAVAIALRLDDVELLAEINAILENISSEEREAFMTEAISRQP